MQRIEQANYYFHDAFILWPFFIISEKINYRITQMKKKLKEFLNKLGYTVSRKNTDSYNDIADKEFWEIYNLCKPYTLTSIERMYALFCATKYIISNHIKGDFIECGVWRGGSAMLIAKILYNRNITDRKIYLFDTFEGMPDATNHDVDFRGTSAMNF